jgi:hypothetical protein
MDDELTMKGTFLYDGTVVCDIRICRTSFRPGTGDEEDAEADREDRQGEFYYIDYGSPAARGQYPSRSVYFDSLPEAVQHAALLPGLEWESDGHPTLVIRGAGMN